MTDDLAFEVLASEWDELIGQSEQRVFFLRLAWNRLWWRIFRPANSHLFIITCRDDEGRLVGLAPFYWRQRRMAGIPHIRELLLLGTGVFVRTSEYVDIIARSGYEKMVAQTVAGFLHESANWDQLWLNEVPASSRMLPHFREAMGEGSKLESCSRSHYIDTNTSWETFTGGLSRGMRQNLLRRTRKLLDSYECKFHRIEKDEELVPAIAAFVDLHQARWQSKGEPGSFAIPGVREFLTEAMLISLAEGRLRLWTLELDGQIAAVRLGFLDNGVLHCFQGGFDPSHAQEGLGSVMLGLCIRACTEDDRVLEYDFMGGSNEYKEAWSKLERENVCVTWLRSGTRSLAYKGIERAEAIGRSLVRATVSPGIRRAAHRAILQKRHYSSPLPAGRKERAVEVQAKGAFEIRVAGEDDRDRIVALMSNIYPGDMRARYEWLYRSNPHGRALTWLAIERSSGQTVGCTSIFPRNVIVAGRERVGGIGGDCYIDTRARRRGLATALHRASFAEMHELGVDFMYGPPNHSNLGALVKAGSRVVTRYRRWVRPLLRRGAHSWTMGTLKAHLAGVPITVLERLGGTDASGFQLELVSEFGREFEEMFARGVATHRIACVRDRQYLNWRYLSVAESRQIRLAVKRSGELVGFVALEPCGEHAAIADMFLANDPKLIDAALQLLIEYAANAGCSSLELSMTQGCAITSRLRRLGFIGRDERGFQVAVSDGDSQADVLLSANAWHFTEADQDLDTVFVKSLAG